MLLFALLLRARGEEVVLAVVGQERDHGPAGCVVGTGAGAKRARKDCRAKSA